MPTKTSQQTPGSAQTLIVLGAGPKGLAIAAKRETLRRLGYDVPQLVVVDRTGVASHWTGDSGLTDGRRILGTLPEKDVGYPYASACWGDAEANAAVNAAMLAYSWQAYLLDEYRYADWVDRGRPRPTHGEWSRYLQWVAKRLGLTIHQGEVTALASDGARWQVTCAPSPTAAGAGKSFVVTGDGLVLTGPGRPITLPGQPTGLPNVLDGANVWRHIGEWASNAAPLSIGVIGTGETAAAIVVSLVEALGDLALIEVISPHGVLYSRDEGYQENRLFSDPDARWVSLTATGKQQWDEADRWADLHENHRQSLRWSAMTLEDRREFVRRTDRGVFSVQAMQDLTRARNVRPVLGAATGMRAHGGCVTVELAYDGQTSHAHYDYVVVARGFDPLWFTTLFDAPMAERFRAALGVSPERGADERIAYDLAVEGFTPRLHLPMAAGVAQGPGFPNLSCLGLLADRVLRPYTGDPQPRGATPTGGD